MNHPCPSRETLLALLEGELIDQDSARLNDHVDECNQCQQSLENLVVHSDTATISVDAQPTPTNTTKSTTASSVRWGENQRKRIVDGVRDAIHVEAADDLRLPCRLGDYELQEVLGAGGMGVVYRARQSSLNRTVAVKVVGRGRFAGEEIVERFFREAESAAMLDHPGIVPIHDVGEASGRVFYAMGFMPGGNLAQALSDRPFPPMRAAHCLREIAKAIAYAHQRGVIHRDLKPANILLDEDGSPKVADFGLAKQIGSAVNLTVTGQVLGTPSYMPPEQTRVTSEEVTAEGDVYSLGAILYHLLTGRPPFVAIEPLDVMHQLIHDDPISPRKLNPTIPRDLETITLKCLEKSPSHRYSSASDLVDELDRHAQGRPIVARPLGFAGRMWRWGRRNRTVAAMSISIIVLMIFSTVTSTYLATLARNRAASLRVSNDALIVAEAEAKRSAAEARDQALLATEQAGGALRVLETMLFDLQAPFEHDAAAQEDRRQLLNSVLRELEHLPSEQLNQNRILRCRAHAMLGLADTVTQAGNGNGLATSEGSAGLYQQSIDLLKELRLREPEHVGHLEELATAYEQYAAALADDHQWGEAKTLFQNALSLRRDLVTQSEDDLQATLKLAHVEIDSGESLLYTGKTQEGYDRYIQGHDRIVMLARQHPDHRFVREVRCRACRNIVDFHRKQGDVEQAQAFANEFIEVAADLSADYPFDYDVQMNHSTAYERAGLVSLLRGDVAKAIQEFEESLRLCVDLGIAAPENDEIQFDVSFSYQQLADAYLRAGDLAKAQEAAEQCVKMRRALVKTGPTIPLRTVKLNHALKALARTHQRQGNPALAAELYREAIDHASQFNVKTGTKRFGKEIESLRSKLSKIQTPAKAAQARLNGN